MAHYALVNKDNIVLRVIVCDIDPISFNEQRKEAEAVQGRWLQTSYNTRGGIHYNQDGTPSEKPGFRGNYAGVGDTYIDELDAFVLPSPGPLWTLDTTTFQWKPPTGTQPPVTQPQVTPLPFKTFEYSSNTIHDSGSNNVRTL